MKARKAFIGAFFVAFVAFLLIAATPLALSAAPAIRNFSIDRSSVTPGQNITITVETTADTQFVFAMADGVRTQGERTSGNNWAIRVSPTASTTVTIFANTENNETNAARASVPVTVGAATAPTPPPVAPPIAPVAATVPPAPANLGPIAIASVTETPATAAGMVQLTVVTGREANEVWVNFDRTNNQRGTGRFARATELRQGAHYRVWVIDFRPAQWAAQRVEVGSNRTYNWPGAATRAVDLTLAQPYVRTGNPRIESVSVSNRTVTTGANVTFNIRTNADADHVWVRSVDGTEFTATAGTTTGTSRNWSVTFNPVRTGSVHVFANTTRDEAGASRRSESITVGAVTAQIIGTPTASWVDGNRVRIHATTNESANSVWVIEPWSNQRRQFSRTTAGANTWTVDITDTLWWDHWGHHHWGNLVIHASNQTGGGAVSQDSRTIASPTGWWGGTGHLGSGAIRSIIPTGMQSMRVGEARSFTFTIETWGTTHLWADSTVAGITVSPQVSHGVDVGGGIRRHTVTVSASAGVPIGTHRVWVSTHLQHHLHHHNTVEITINVTG